MLGYRVFRICELGADERFVSIVVRLVKSDVGIQIVFAKQIHASASV